MKVKMTDGTLGLTESTAWRQRSDFSHFQFITIEGELFDTSEIGDTVIILYADSLKAIEFQETVRNLVNQRTLKVVVLVITNDKLEELRDIANSISDGWTMASSFASCISPVPFRARMKSKVYKGVTFYANAVAVVDIQGKVLYGEITTNLEHQVNVDNIIASLQK